MLPTSLELLGAARPLTEAEATGMGGTRPPLRIEALEPAESVPVAVRPGEPLIPGSG